MLSLLEETKTPCAVFDAHHSLLWMNQAYENLAGYAALPALVGKTLSPSEPDRKQTISVGAQLYSATQLWLTDLAEGQGGYLLTLHPTGTGIAAPAASNTVFIAPEAFTQQIERHVEQGVAFALLYIELAGLAMADATEVDELVVRAAVSQLIQKTTREQDIVCCLGDSSYGVLLPRCTFATVLNRIGLGMLVRAPQLFDALPSDLLAGQARLDVGAALFPHHGSDASQISQAAEGALALAQTAPVSDFYLFDVPSPE